MLRKGRNAWRIERTQRAALVVDAADYFRLAREAMLRAKKQIFLIGWDFDTRIFLDPGEAGPGDENAPTKLGPLLSWLAKHRPGIRIYILKWDVGAIKLLGRGSTIFRLARWAATPQISFKLDGAHPTGASHHQKILVIDDSLAFCGGIDMTASRWDTRLHCDDDDRRRRPTTGRRYMPWHDATMAVDGDAARALGDLARERWIAAGGKAVPKCKVKSDPWPKGLAPAFTDVDVAIARTRAAHERISEVREIEALYLDMIRRAKHFVYAENQFFASRIVAEAICERLNETRGPEFLLVNPKIAEGWVEEEAMSPARAQLMAMLKKTRFPERFRIYTPVTEGGDDIYVHSKVTIVDDKLLRVGSANMNNRSMGLDSECDLLIDATLEANAGTGRKIAAIRADLLAEHLGVTAARVERSLKDKGSLIAAVETLRGKGRTLVRFVPKKPNETERKLADKELLDPESSADSEPIARPGLLAGLRERVRRT
jgi:phosphatidylserine/phosphatidylglycerophosphate/cardiolipin synthase-like enzyme